MCNQENELSSVKEDGAEGLWLNTVVGQTLLVADSLSVISNISVSFLRSICVSIKFRKQREKNGYSDGQEESTKILYFQGSEQVWQYQWLWIPDHTPTAPIAPHSGELVKT